MMQLFCTHLLVLSILLTSLLGVGSLIFHFARIKIKDTYTNLFAKYVLASTLLVLCTALYYTKGATIHLLFLPILGAFVYWYWHKPADETKLEISVNTKNGACLYLTLFAGALALFVLRFGQLYNPASDIPLLPHSDTVFYANCIDFLVFFGKENSSVDYVYGANSGTSPYHYYELWYGAGVSRLFGQNTALSLVLIVFTTSLFVIWLGLCAVLEYYKKLNFTDVLFCFGAVFLCGLAFSVFTEVPFMRNIYVFSRNAWSYPKLFPIYFYTLSALLFFMRNKQKEGLLCLLSLPIVFISTSVGIFAGIATALLFSLFRTKLPRPKIYAAIVLTAIAIGCFYLFLTVQTSTHVSIGLADTLQKIIHPAFLSTSINICVGATLQMVLLFSPFVALYFIFNKQRPFKQIALDFRFHILVFVYVFSLMGWAVLHDKLSTVQVFANVSIVFLNIGAAWLVINLWANNQPLFSLPKLIAIGFLLVGVWNSAREYRVGYQQNNLFVSQVTNTPNLSPLGGFMYDSLDYKNSEFGYVANFDILGKYLIYAPSRTFPLSLSPHSFPVSKDSKLANIQSLCLKNTPFWIYVEEEKKKGVFESIINSQAKFIDTLKIKYLICSKNVVLPDVLSQKIEKEVVDPNTGERFMLLK
jgi:hypothetical protein